MLSPTGVSTQPPPLCPPCSDTVAGDLSDWFSSSISSPARRYDMSRLRAAAEIEPCSRTASSNSTLPGPSATVSPLRMRIRKRTSGRVFVRDEVEAGGGACVPFLMPALAPTFFAGTDWVFADSAMRESIHEAACEATLENGVLRET